MSLTGFFLLPKIVKRSKNDVDTYFYVPLAQLDRASDYGSEG